MRKRKMVMVSFALANYKIHPTVYQFYTLLLDKKFSTYSEIKNEVARTIGNTTKAVIILNIQKVKENNYV